MPTRIFICEMGAIVCILILFLDKTKSITHVLLARMHEMYESHPIYQSGVSLNGWYLLIHTFIHRGGGARATQQTLKHRQKGIVEKKPAEQGQREKEEEETGMSL